MRLSLALAVLLAVPAAAADEITVGWISRTPELSYVWGSATPTVEGWPASGQPVTWRAHVRTWTDRRPTVSYRWIMDGFEVATGTVTLADGVTTVDFPWLWTFDRHRLAFEIDTTNAVAEESEQNNALAVFTDALSVGFWVEQSFYDYWREHQHELGTGSTSFENWVQRTIAYWNDMSALAVYPETPHGVLDRWRIQKIVVVPDGALPLSGLPDDASPDATGGTHPDQHDRTVDLMWGFRAVTIPTYSSRSTSASPFSVFEIGYIALHEMGHARYLADLYAWDVVHRPPHYVIEIRENGQSIVGDYVPNVHRTAEQGLMNAHYSFIDRYSAIALNAIHRQRATYGNYNEPRNFASFLNDLPAQNRLTVRDANGQPIPNADVWIYQSVANAPAWYATRYDNEPDLRLRTDENGQVLVGRSPFAPDGQVVHTYGMTNGTAIVRVATGSEVAYGFLESRLFNLAYWRGQTDFADHDLYVGLECSREGPALVSPEWNSATANEVTLRWKPQAGASSYRVYASSNLGRPRLVATTTATEATVRLTGRVHWWVESELGPCGTRRSSTGALNAPEAAPRRRAVRH